MIFYGREVMKMTDIKSIISRLRESVENSGFSYVELEKRTGIAKSSIRGSLETVDTQRLQGFFHFYFNALKMKSVVTP